MSGPLGTSGGGATGVNSVSAGTGISVSGSTSLTVTNTGVTSLVAGTNVSVSGATGAVTVNAPAFGTTITASTIGGTAAAGTSTTVAREDHKHAFPAGAAPSSLLVASTQATGTSASPALADHVHAMPGSAVAGASAVGDTAATGSATTVALSDHRHSREAFGTPIAVTGGATAASGSATTIARSDHVHSTASMPVLIATSGALGSAVTEYTFSSIPQTYSSLHLRGSAGSDLTGAYTSLQFQANGDTGSNYVQLGWDSSGASQSTVISATIQLVPKSGNFTTARTPVNTIIENYTASTGHYLQSPVLANLSTTVYSLYAGVVYNYHTNTSPITSIRLFISGGGNFQAGTKFNLYGIP